MKTLITNMLYAVVLVLTVGLVVGVSVPAAAGSGSGHDERAVEMVKQDEAMKAADQKKAEAMVVDSSDELNGLIGLEGLEGLEGLLGAVGE
jgi:hypothetical protein